MKESTKIYWKSIEELKNDPEFLKNAHNEFAQAPAEDPGHSRRDFLKMMGFGVSAAMVAACEAPVRHAIPYVVKPADVEPGMANYYATSYIDGGDYCSITVKTREGRPIKIEGNTLSSVSRGGRSAQAEASVLSLYDNSRLRSPRAGGAKKNRIEWAELDKQVIAKLTEIAAAGGQIRIISNTILSPSTKAVIERFRSKYPTTQHIMYDPISHYGMLKANEQSFGTAMIPSYDFSQANVIVGIGADFLGTWLAPVEFSMQYAKTRVVNEQKRDMSKHYQFESIFTMTGASADHRVAVKPSETDAVVVQLYNLIAAKAGRQTVSGGADKPFLKKAADELWANRGKALVVAGSNDISVQVIVNAINDMLGSYGTTILPQLPMYYRQGNDEAMAAFVNDLGAGRIGAVIFYGCNPAYDHPMGASIAAGLAKTSLSISTAIKEDETAVLSAYIAPDHHYLESWGDAEPKKNHFSFMQPTITPIFLTRAGQESLLTWAGETQVDYFEFVKNNWRRFYTGQTADYQSFWDTCLYNGVYELPVEAVSVSFNGNVSAAANLIASSAKPGTKELVIHESPTLGNGSQANNPLLQELPHPITRAVWDHYVTISPKDAEGLTTPESKTRFASITINGVNIKLPILIQPGQPAGTLGIELGYGRTNAGKVAAQSGGVNMYPFVKMVNGSLSYTQFDVTFEILWDDHFQLAQVQTQDTHMGRQTVIQETLLSKFKENPSAGEYDPKISSWRDPNHKVEPKDVSLWRPHEYKMHHWAMSIDLNACNGCGACVVACNVENNIPVVGREEVIRRREMHWLRIDRYYSSDAPPDNWEELEDVAENPEVVFQPMLCQHCNNAPCETVCPVLATTHSTEGLNQMTYNRCIGTRYCANNCPYKVRRFNWFKYHDNRQFENVNVSMNTELGMMVLNPDVVVRSRGVMEKCTFCVQRIQLGKLNAKKERREMRDGDVTTACASACSTGAIVFGDINDPESSVSKLLKIKPFYPEHPHRVEKVSENPRAYNVLDEIGTRPNIWYLRKVRNKDQENA